MPIIRVALAVAVLVALSLGVPLVGAGARASADPMSFRIVPLGDPTHCRASSCVDVIAAEGEIDEEQSRSLSSVRKGARERSQSAHRGAAPLAGRSRRRIDAAWR